MLHCQILLGVHILVFASFVLFKFIEFRINSVKYERMVLKFS